MQFSLSFHIFPSLLPGLYIFFALFLIVLSFSITFIYFEMTYLSPSHFLSLFQCIFFLALLLPFLVTHELINVRFLSLYCPSLSLSYVSSLVLAPSLSLTLSPALRSWVSFDSQFCVIWVTVTRLGCREECGDRDSALGAVSGGEVRTEAQDHLQSWGPRSSLLLSIAPRTPATRAPGHAAACFLNQPTLLSYRPLPLY